MKPFRFHALSPSLYCQRTLGTLFRRLLHRGTNGSFYSWDFSSLTLTPSRLFVRKPAKLTTSSLSLSRSTYNKDKKNHRDLNPSFTPFYVFVISKERIKSNEPAYCPLLKETADINLYEYIGRKKHCQEVFGFFITFFGSFDFLLTIGKRE